MSYNNSSIPLHLQKGFDKDKHDKGSASFQSFRDNKQHKANDGTKEMKGHVGNVDLNRVPRYPNGQIDTVNIVHQLLEATKKMESTGIVQPYEAALLTVLFPEKFRIVDPALAKLRTQLSDSEQQQIKGLYAAKLAEIENWNAGYGGSSTPGKTRSYGY